jgi:hypothetical protein
VRPGALLSDGGADDSDLHFHLARDSQADAAAARSAFKVDKVR